MFRNINSDFDYDLNDNQYDMESECNYRSYMEWAFSGDNYSLNRLLMIDFQKNKGVFSDSFIDKLFPDEEKSFILNLDNCALTLDDFNLKSDSVEVLSLKHSLNLGNIENKPIFIKYISLRSSSLGDISFEILIGRDAKAMEEYEETYDNKIIFNVGLNSYYSRGVRCFKECYDENYVLNFLNN